MNTSSPAAATPLSFTMPPVYSDVIEMVMLLQTQYAALLYATVKAVTVKKENARNRMLFVPSSSTSSPCQDDDASVHSTNSVDSNASFCQQLNNTSSRMWTTPECHSTQVGTVETSYSMKNVRGLVAVDQTGGGKMQCSPCCCSFKPRWYLLYAKMIVL